MDNITLNKAYLTAADLVTALDNVTALATELARILSPIARSIPDEGATINGQQQLDATGSFRMASGTISKVSGKEGKQ